MYTTTEKAGRPHATQRFKSVYVHFPFCETKCHYCDFFSLPEDKVESNERARIYSAIECELNMFAPHLEQELDTVFLGGGTPSLVPLEAMASLIAKLKLGARTEVTMEANPSSITLERAREWKRLGIKRISMGVQALEDERLKWLGRIHSKAEVFEALTALSEAGFERLSTDYIVGVPGQTSELIKNELGELLIRFPRISHISAYLLTLKPSNPKFGQLPNEETQLEHLRTVSGVLKSFGFEQYEISNFARPGGRALHNENYWLGGAYLGIGPSAHSFWDKTQTRTKNWASLGKYCEVVESGFIPSEWTETLTDEEKRIEYLMLRLRRADGLDFQEYQAIYGRDLYQEKKSWIDLWQHKGLCTVSDRLRLTSDGFFLSDQILSNIL